MNNSPKNIKLSKFFGVLMNLTVSDKKPLWMKIRNISGDEKKTARMKIPD